ncbi:MAG: universal stress protein [Rhodoglobus sp.]
MSATPTPGAVAAGKAPGTPAPEGSLRQLTPLLVWAVVFCDIGTSVYYVPGILYKQVGDTAPLFVIAAMIGFLFLAAKYVEICWRNPDGGGVVSVATQAFSPIVGCIGGLLITVDYFLTSAISSVSGIHYLGSIFPSLEEHVVGLSVATLLLLAIVNTIGIRESAALALVMAIVAFVVDVVVIGIVGWHMGPEQWAAVRANLGQFRELGGSAFLVGFSGAWLAFSGLESISQLSPAMRLPISATAKRGMRYVVITMVASAPILTLLTVALLPLVTKQAHDERFISEIGALYGGDLIKLAVVITASSLLVFASNTAIIGGYHVFLALAERGFMPSAIAHRNRYFGTPQLAILVTTIVPTFIIYFAHGDTEILGNLYAFGLLGCFVLSSAGLDVLRWREGQRGLRFWIGIATTGMVVVAWGTNLVHKHEATLFGSLLVGIGLLMAVGTRRKWFAEWLYHMPLLVKIFPRRVERAEEDLEHIEQLEILSLTQAESIAQLYPSSTMIAMRSANPGLIAEAIAREKGRGGKTLYALYVEERTGLFVRDWAWHPKAEGVEALRAAAQAAESEGMTLIPVWTVSYNAVEGILRAAENLGVTAIMIGATQRSAVYHLLRGHVLAGLTKRLPPGIRLLIYG